MTSAKRPDIHLLESGARLSRSLLWRLQRRFFEQRGPSAFADGIVPHYITSNPFIAQAYARVVVGYLRDIKPQLCAGEPIYIVELGAGSGRFGFLFLKKLLGILAHSPLRDLPVRYVLTDFTNSNVDAWLAHPQLAPFVDSGHLDFAMFDAERPADLVLRRSGTSLSAATLKNPLVVLCNYVFDGISQDAFRIKAGQLYESLVTLTSAKQEPNLDDPELLGRLDVTYQHRPVATDYYDDSAWNRLLRAYAQRMAETTLLFPCAALKCLRFLRELSGDRLLMLSGDKGNHGETSQVSRSEPGIKRHGSISLMVNYHAIGEYVRQEGGHALGTPHLHASLNVSVFLFGSHEFDHIETRHAYREAVESFGPDDFFHVKKATEGHFDQLKVEQVLSLLRLSGWDPRFLRGCFKTLMEKLPTSSRPWQQELRRAIEAVWDMYFHIGEEWDLAFHLGVLLLAIGEFRGAGEYFQRSVELFGAEAATLKNLALCRERLGEMEVARPHLEQAQKVAPDSAPATAQQPLPEPPQRSRRVGHSFGRLRVR